MATASVSTASIRPADIPDLRLGLDWPILSAAYARWRAEDLFPLIFHRSQDMTLGEFLDWNYRPTVEPVGCYVGEALIGLGWICQAHLIDGEVSAEVGCAFFKGTPLSQWHAALDLFVRHAFIDRGFDAIYGVSARHNPAAQQILDYCGMTPAESLPWGEEVDSDTMIYGLRRKDWD